MDGSAVVKRYADGFLEFAKDSIGPATALEELKEIKGVFGAHPEFESFLNNPSLTYSEKCGAINDVLGKGISRESLAFMMLLLKKDRMGEFDRIAEYARVKYAHGDKLETILKASYPLDTPVIEKIKSELEDIMEKKLHVYMKLEPELLGGVRAEINSFVFDGSLKKRLEDLRRKLMSVKVD